MEVRDLWPEFAVQVGVLRNRILIWLSRRLERFLYRRADQLVVNSPGFVPYLKQAGADIHSIAIVPNGVDTGGFIMEPNGGELRTQHGLEGKFIALYAGAHGMANDLWQVLEAAESVREDTRIAFVLIGDGAEKQALLAGAQAKGLTNIHFLAPVPKERIPEVMAEADCGIAVLKALAMFTITYPNKVFDYMAAGVPVVLAIDGVMREVIEEADAGIYVEPGDAAALGQAVRRLADDPARAKVMGSNGRRQVKVQFDRPKLAAEMEALLRSVSHL
jgi:glycosyltransferase involved in cell wall biosynthesis